MCSGSLALSVAAAAAAALPLSVDDAEADALPPPRVDARLRAAELLTLPFPAFFLSPRDRLRGLAESTASTGVSPFSVVAFSLVPEPRPDTALPLVLTIFTGSSGCAREKGPCQRLRLVTFPIPWAERVWIFFPAHTQTS